MQLSSFMSQNLNALQHTVSMSLLDSQLSTQTAQAKVMMDDLSQAQNETKGAPHPTSGQNLDMKA